MAMFRKLFYRKPPDGLLDICERVYVFDCCFTTDAWEEEDYKDYVGGTIGQLREHYTDASILVFNFRESETESQIANVLSEYDMTIMDYPRHYEGCPLLSLELIHHFLRSSESWLSLGQQNVLLMHCERGGWPVLAFMLAALLIYRKHYTGEQKTLDMIYKQAPRELLYLLTPLNPLPSQLRYLQYISRRNVASEWPPLDRALTLDCVIIRMFPNFDGQGGCRPIFRIYGQDPFLVGDRTPKVLFSTPKRNKTIRHYKQAECELIKIDINCNIQGDVVLECISLYDDMEREEMMFRVMFNTAFIRSNILMLNLDEIDTLWDAKDQFPKGFRAEVLFSDMGSAASIVPVDLSCFEEKNGLPVEAFAKVQEIFSSVDWLVPNADAALNVLQQITASNIVQEKLDTGSHQSMERITSLHELTHEKRQEKDGVVSTSALPPSHRTTSKPMHPSFTEQPETYIKSSGQSSLVPPPASETPSTGAIPRPPPPPPPPTKPLKDPVIETGKPLSISPPPLPPAAAVKDDMAAKIEPSSTPAPSTVSYPITSPSKDDTATRIGPAQPPFPPLPPSPTLPLKNDTTSRIESPTSTSSPPHTLPSKNYADTRIKPPPPPPPTTPPLKESRDGRIEPPPLFRSPSTPPPPPTPPLKNSIFKAGSPPHSPLPLRFGQAASPTISSPVPPPPPPPAPISASQHLDHASHNSLHVPSAPPFPVPPVKANAKMGAVPAQSISTGSVGGPGSPSPPPPIPPSSTKGRALSRTMASRNHQTKKLKPLHWLKLTRAVQGSLWAEAQKSGEASKAPEIDIRELESLFEVTVPNSGQGGSGGKSNSRASLGKSEKVQLIEHRRAYNCEIMLSKVKIPLHELTSSVLTLENSALDIDQVENLIKFCPTKEEMELLKGYKGEKDKLGKCELFFLELMQVPRVESKFRVFSFKIQFDSQVSDLRNSLRVVNLAAEQIRGSTKLKRVMQTILSLGNALNQGTARGSAIGFRLDSLLKLTETRARNNKMTLMHYLSKVLADKLPELLDFSEDLASLEPASKIQLKYLAEEMQAINKGLEKVVQELSISENDGPVSEDFRKTLKKFLCFAEVEVRSLASLYSGVGRNVDALILYFGEDPSRCPFEQVVSTLLKFVRMFNQAHEENRKQLEFERKQLEKQAASEKLKRNASQKATEQLIRSPVKSVK